MVYTVPMHEVAYALKKIEETPRGRLERWLYISTVGGIREGVWIPKWSDRKLFTERDDIRYWKQRMGGAVVRVRKTVIKTLDTPLKSPSDVTPKAPSLATRTSSHAGQKNGIHSVSG